MYLNLLTFSDVTTTSGKHIENFASSNNKSDCQENKLKRPSLKIPDDQYWQTWRVFLKQLRPGKLKLGKLFNNHHQKWSWFKTQEGNVVYKTKNEMKVYKRLKLFTAPVFRQSNGSDTSGKTAIVSVIKRSNGVYIKDVGDPHLIRTPTEKDSVILKSIINHQLVQGDVDINEIVYAVVDATVADEKARFGWVIGKKSSSLVTTGYGAVRTVTSMESFQAEFEGIFSVLQYLQNMRKTKLCYSVTTKQQSIA